jgi:hypothetical protein
MVGNTAMVGAPIFYPKISPNLEASSQIINFGLNYFRGYKGVAGAQFEIVHIGGAHF